jgi:hypothetical protein
MKMIIRNIFFICAMSICQALASDIPASDWGPTNCGAIMALSLPNSATQFKTNQPINVAICIKNVSEGILYLMDTKDTDDFTFVIISPSNKDVSPAAHPGNGLHLRNITRTVNPNDNMNYLIDLGEVCKFSEIGTYKVTAKRKVIPGCETTSNTLNILIVPGEWKSDSTNAPRIGF